jgi:hypothetical protein
MFPEPGFYSSFHGWCKYYTQSNPDTTPSSHTRHFFASRNSLLFPTCTEKETEIFENFKVQTKKHPPTPAFFAMLFAMGEGDGIDRPIKGKSDDHKDLR